ncbi:NAD(P)H-binding protein [Evansella sp. AB-rgal1]|uniref:NAD(P)H-binding protein n=1 Tax=Evansella sp. AB-rgal1 TaxID=3242696 RepID=UPI00359E4D16
MDKVAIIGGTGKVGRYIANKALQKGYQVRMLVRNPEKSSYIDNGIEIVKGEIQNLETIKKLIKGCNIVVNTFGQPVRATPMYSELTKNLLVLMKEVNIRRYIGVSGGSLTIEGDRKNFTNIFAAKVFEVFFSKMMRDKKREWEILFNNKEINWTLIRLPFVVEGAEIGSIKESVTDMPGRKIQNQDIATFIINQIESSKYIHKSPFISN